MLVLLLDVLVCFLAPFIILRNQTAKGQVEEVFLPILRDIAVQLVSNSRVGVKKNVHHLPLVFNKRASSVLTEGGKNKVPLESKVLDVQVMQKLLLFNIPLKLLPLFYLLSNPLLCQHRV